MNDIFSKKKRSLIMSKIKSSKNVSTELKLISVFRENSIKGWRRNYKLTGKPDFVFKFNKIAVFTDGCFWHGHRCRNITPKDNSDYWSTKIQQNEKRDRKITKFLKQNGWRVLRIWECELKNKNRKKLMKKINCLIKK